MTGLHTHTLDGCTPTPLAGYLKALGVLRLLASTANTVTGEAADPAARETELLEEYREQFFNPYRAADVGQIDEVIEPRETRPRLARALEVLRTIHSFDPCLACAIHTQDVEGKELARVRVL